MRSTDYVSFIDDIGSIEGQYLYTTRHVGGMNPLYIIPVQLNPQLEAESHGLQH